MYRKTEDPSKTKTLENEDRHEGSKGQANRGVSEKNNRRPGRSRMMSTFRKFNLPQLVRTDTVTTELT